MFGLFDKKNRNLNTIGLYGDMDDVELLIEIEELFGIKISDEEAESTMTAGQLSELVKSKFKESEHFDPIWEIVRLCIAQYGEQRNMRVNKSTTFFAEDAKERR